MTLDAVLRHPFGGPVVVATLCLLLIGVSKATGYLFDWIGRRLDYWSICREMRQERREQAEYHRRATEERTRLRAYESEQRRRLDAAVVLPDQAWRR